MKNHQLSNQLQNIKDNIEKTYRAIKTTVDNAKGLVKKENKKLMKKAVKSIYQLKGDEKFFDSSDNYKYEESFLSESLQLQIHQTPVNIVSNQNIDIKILIKDERFFEFLTLIIFFNNIYSNFNSFEKLNTMIKSQMYKDLRDYFGDINKIFLSYCLLQERNLSLTVIQNITSFICKDSIVKNEDSLSKNQKEKLEQILTGIKYTKLKTELLNNTDSRIYNKKEKFDILENAKQSIIIHYISTKNRKHSFHSSPITHERKGHYRTLKSGKVIWIEQIVVNSNRIAV